MAYLQSITMLSGPPPLPAPLAVEELDERFVVTGTNQNPPALNGVSCGCAVES